MAEVGFFRRVAPAVILAAAGGLLLYLLPSGADSESGAEDLGASEDGFPSAAASADTGGASSATAGPAPATSSAAAGASSAPAQRVIKGDAINFRFGTVQVKILVEGTTLVDIATMQAPGGGYQPYTDRAIPGMKAKILKAQSTQVSSVSGATYTSEAYAQSVQSALDKA